MIRQGIHRRHPRTVLNQYQGVQSTTENAESVWEQALMQEQKRQGLDKIFASDGGGDVDMMVNQMGLVQTALKNYENSKYKLERSHMVGV